MTGRTRACGAHFYSAPLRTDDWYLAVYHAVCKEFRLIMGGYGSGRSRLRLSTAECLSIDVHVLRRGNALVSGAAGFFNWGDRLSVEFRASRESLALSSVHGVQDILLRWSPCRFGGEQAFFECPARQCRNAAAKLYWPGRGGFFCRRCLHLQYPSQRLRRSERLHRRARELRRKLGDPHPDLLYYIERPPRMWRRTYRRLCDQLSVVEDESNEEYNELLRSLVSRHCR